MNLLLPFVDDFVECLLFLLQGRHSSRVMFGFQFVGVCFGGESKNPALFEYLSISQSKPALGVLQCDDLGVAGVELVLDLGGLLVLSSLDLIEFVCSDQTLCLELRSPGIQFGLNLDYFTIFGIVIPWLSGAGGRTRSFQQPRLRRTP